MAVPRVEVMVPRVAGGSGDGGTLTTFGCRRLGGGGDNGLAAMRGGEVAVVSPRRRVAGGRRVGVESRVTEGGGEAKGVPKLRVTGRAGRRWARQRATDRAATGRSRLNHALGSSLA
jgi:hypothetical protein